MVSNHGGSLRGWERVEKGKFLYIYSAARAGSPSSDPPVYSFEHMELFTRITDGESPTLNLSRNACDAM